MMPFVFLESIYTLLLQDFEFFILLSLNKFPAPFCLYSPSDNFHIYRWNFFLAGSKFTQAIFFLVVVVLEESLLFICFNLCAISHLIDTIYKVFCEMKISISIFILICLQFIYFSWGKECKKWLRLHIS